MYVYGAKYLSMTNVNIYKLLFFDGIIGMILSELLQIISHFVKNCDKIETFFFEDAPYCNGKIIKTMIGSFKGLKNPFNIIYSILLVIIHFCETWSIWLLIINFSVNHYAAFNSISLFFNFLNFDDIDPVCILGIIIIFFTVLVYNEIIILKFYNLNKNTAVEISKRSMKDTKCDFGEDEDEIYTKSDDNYIIIKEDVGDINDDINSETL